MNEQEIKFGVYKHFKGKLYEVIGIAKHTEREGEHTEREGEKLVVYRALYDDSKKRIRYGQLFVRPVESFLGTKTINGKEVQRFEYVGRKCLETKIVGN